MQTSKTYANIFDINGGDIASRPNPQKTNMELV